MFFVNAEVVLRLTRHWLLVLLLIAGLPFAARAQSTYSLRVMAANTSSGNGQSYEGPGIRIFQGLKPDVVAIQEFRYNSSSTSNSLRTLVDTAFGSEFSFYVEPSGSIPNGIVSRWPILDAGSWDDPLLSDRGFAWAQIDLPGTNDLYAVSVHLYSSGSATDRNTEATIIKSNIQAQFPAGAWVVVAGDMNTDNRSEAAITTFKTFLSDNPIPTDLVSGGNPNTSEPRSKPYDYVLPSFGLATYQSPVTLGAQTFNNGLVFDSEVYFTNYSLAAVAPAQVGDSHVSGMQHMAVIKNFQIPFSGAVTNPPEITLQPQSQTNVVGATVTFQSAATSLTPLTYQWYFNGTNLLGGTATDLELTNIQFEDAGSYRIVFSNAAGSVTSEVAILTVLGQPAITAQPQSLAVSPGANAPFSVGANGATPLRYQWFFGANGIAGATNSAYTRSNAQPADAGNYTVVITNNFGSVTSATAVLTIHPESSGELQTLAGWDVTGLSGYGASPLPPTTNAANITVVGLTRGAGVGTSGTAAGSAWGGNGFDSANASAAITAQDFATFSITVNGGYTVSFTNVSRFDYRRSGTGPGSGLLQYQVGNGSFVDISSLSYPISTSGGASIGTIDLSSISALQHVPASNTVTFRIVNYAASGSGGTWYIYNVANSSAVDFSIDGTVNPITVPTNPPAIAPLLTNTAVFGDQFQFLLLGTASSNYVVEATTDVGSPDWAPVETNTSPFLYIETNVQTRPLRFFRGRVSP